MRIFYQEHILDLLLSPDVNEDKSFSRKELLKVWDASDSTSTTYYFSTEESRSAWLDTEFTPIHAAGGLVINDTNQILLMIRRGKWDLPKGKMETGEIPEITALREIEEETGMGELTLVRPLINTFHLYEENGNWMLKTTHWFLVHAKINGILKPQLEEDITELHWFYPHQLDTVKQNTFANIKLVLDAYLDVEAS
jgi:8-oxo-dGTP pyrophosphatase MutT (NUDIX family)